MMSQRPILGLDVGGANLKFAWKNNTACTPFRMWQQADQLTDQIREVVATLAGEVEAVALTMTGELADCFPTRRGGVEHIVDAVCRAMDNTAIHVYSVDGQWMTPEMARQNPWDVAASNWHALGTWIARSSFLSNSGSADMVVDIGSTTVDIIPLSGGRVATDARTDRQRMQRQQLVYTGYERTPVAVMAHNVMLEGGECPLMSERFADSIDVYLALGYAREDPENTCTADGRGRTREMALARLARMVGEDTETLSQCDIESIAYQLVDRQVELIVTAVQKNLPTLASNRSHTVMLSGHGEYLAHRVRDALSPNGCKFVSMDQLLGLAASRNASAIAVAACLDAWLEANKE